MVRSPFWTPYDAWGWGLGNPWNPYSDPIETGGGGDWWGPYDPSLWGLPWGMIISGLPPGGEPPPKTSPTEPGAYEASGGRPTFRVDSKPGGTSPGQSGAGGRAVRSRTTSPGIPPVAGVGTGGSGGRASGGGTGIPTFDVTGWDWLPQDVNPAMLALLSPELAPNQVYPITPGPTITPYPYEPEVPAEPSPELPPAPPPPELPPPPPPTVPPEEKKPPEKKPVTPSAPMAPLALGGGGSNAPSPGPNAPLVGSNAQIQSLFQGVYQPNHVPSLGEVLSSILYGGGR